MTDCNILTRGDHVGPPKENWRQGLKKKNNMGVGNII